MFFPQGREIVGSWMRFACRFFPSSCLWLSKVDDFPSGHTAQTTNIFWIQCQYNESGAYYIGITSSDSRDFLAIAFHALARLAEFSWRYGTLPYFW